MYGWQVKLCYTRAIPERFRDKELIIKRYINSPSLLYFTVKTSWHVVLRAANIIQ